MLHMQRAKLPARPIETDRLESIMRSREIQSIPLAFFQQRNSKRVFSNWIREILMQNSSRRSSLVARLLASSRARRERATVPIEI